MSVAQAQADIDSAEFAEWVAWHNIEPFTVNRVENMLAILCSLFATAHSPKNKVFSPSDFMLEYGVKTERQTPKDIETKLRVLLNGNN